MKTLWEKLEALDSLMTEGEVIVVDDFHLGVVVYRVRSRLLNAVPGIVGRLLGRGWPRARSWARRLSASNEYAIVRQRLSGVRNAVVEFVEERDGLRSLEIVSMPSRGRVPGRRLFAGGAQQDDCGRRLRCTSDCKWSGGDRAPDRCSTCLPHPEGSDVAGQPMQVGFGRFAMPTAVSCDFVPLMR